VRFVSYRDRDGDRVGVVEGDEVFGLRGISRVDQATDAGRLLTAAARDSKGIPFDELELLPAVRRPGKVFCVGLNYRSHIEETQRELPSYPVLFPKYAGSLIAHGEPISLPPESRQVDYEAEVAVVIGRPGRRISRQAALEHVLGYTICNDVTMRDFQYLTHQWLQGKAWDRSTPLGPVIVTPDEVDVDNLDISLRLNGEVLQSSNTSLLIFDVAELIERISTFTALEVGDVILTGTPGGVGFRRDPQVFLEDGDVVEVDVEGLGTLRNPVQAERDV
jgi:acylpyruvate hydrolase